MEQDDIGLGHIEHAKGHRCTQAQRHGQCGCLDVDLSHRGEDKMGQVLSQFPPTLLAQRLEVSSVR
jgi:hypothetical protein